MKTHRLLPALTAILILLVGVGAAHAQKLIVFAPSSMTDVMAAIAQSYQQEEQGEISLSFAGTSQLARQLDGGAPAGVFITADKRWMDWASERDLIDPATYVKFAGNRLVIAIGKDVPSPDDPKSLLTKGFFAMAEPDAVPAGRYAKQALESLGLWAQARKQAIFGENVRVTLRRVALGEVNAALVYATDAQIDPRVRELISIKGEHHDPIAYWAAPVKDADRKSTAFVKFLRSQRVRVILEENGFTVPEGIEQ